MDRRVFVTGSAILCVPMLSGCASSSPTFANDGYCYRAHARPPAKPICLTDSMPSANADEEAKRFAPVPSRVVIYVVRHQIGDTANTVNVGILGSRFVSTIPESLVRIVVPPGVHRLGFEWKKGSGELSVLGSAGQVLFVELRGDLWLWMERYRLRMAETSIRHRARASRLVADLATGEGA